MNQWIWIISIFLVAFVLLIAIRRSRTEGFGEFKDSTIRFVNRQNDFFSKYLKRGVTLNTGINLGFLNSAIKDNNLYNTIPDSEDYTKFFSPDPYAEYFDYDATFCKPARTPRQLPNRDPTKRTQCGWWFVPDAAVPSVGVYGTREEPLVKAGLPKNGQWIWDLNKAVELEEMKMCKRIRSCDLMDLDRVKGTCGFCERRGYAVPIHSDGREKYPESADACGEGVVTSSDKCYRPPPPDLVTDDGINCGNYGRPSSDSSIRLYTQSECDALGGNYVPNGECLMKQGGSFSAACRELNTPPAGERPVCDPDPKGNLSRQCLISLAKGLGYNLSGGVLRMLMNVTGPNETDRYAIDTLKTIGLTIPDAVLGTGNIDKESAARIYSDLFDAMTGGQSQLAREAAKWLVSGTDSFDICDFEGNRTGPFPLNCIQREFRQAGCQPAGAAHPTESNSRALQGMTWSAIGTKFKDLHASMKSPNTDVQRKATKDCLGVDFYKGKDRECCYIMYGDYMATGKAEKVDKLPDGRKVYMRFDHIYTKMVAEDGEARYYVGPVSMFNPANWNTYTVMYEPGKYNIRLGSNAECGQ
jgi:hypothetical protein